MIALAAPLLLALAAGEANGPPLAAYLYDLSTATGVAHSTWAGVTYDRRNDEAYVVYDGLVRIFNKSGMEIYRFGRDEDVGIVMRVAVLDSGDLIVLSSIDGQHVFLHCDFRGRRLDKFEIKGLPPSFHMPFRPDEVVAEAGNVYLAETGLGRVVVTDATGVYRNSYVVSDLIPRKNAKEDLSFGSFSVDPAGNLLFTMPLAFGAAVVSPEGVLRTFGVKGSAPGKFNIAGKLVGDERGDYFVTDKLRSVVMVFDKDLQFIGEFGYRGDEHGNLVAPFDIAAGNGKVIVSQAGNRGVTVFRLFRP